MTELTSRQRAENAAEELAAESLAVTARTVRTRARVDMTVAAAVAREWNEREAEATAIPAMPDTVLKRVEGIWRDAVIAAREEHKAERAGWAAQLAASEVEHNELAEDVARAEAERDDMRAKHDGIADKLVGAEARTAAAESRAAAAESRAAAAEGLAAGLREALSAIAGATNEEP